MLQVDIKVNSEIIGQIEIFNQGTVSRMLADEICKYSWMYIQYDTGEVAKGELFHNRSDGCEQLIKMVLTQYMSGLDKMEVRKLNQNRNYEDIF